MLTISGVNKKIKKIPVLTDITFQFEPAKIYGLFGKNGSGKTMLLRVIAGLVIPNSGTIVYNNLKLHKDISFLPNVGVIIENMSLLPQYDAFTNLSILAKIKKRATSADIEEALIRVGLDPKSKQKVKGFSLGMKQRLNIAQAIFEKPDIILLDEPTNAIDDSGVELIHQLLLEEKERGAMIIVATHHKVDIDSISDVALKMVDGRMFCE
ncbi:ATP-binding cassette domain-containing protein [Listeria grandensis]|uniref:ATP-binding cassette domain-containing protein n=1 Tax=Listeria grandensis TaxID=1494963 RepID=UPI00164CE883|nr:ABC transporter ATP-binding protein [Listeria grandensis]MBC6316362.1 ABC transporter ATP-binding protein [Listeria grandensis]